MKDCGDGLTNPVRISRTFTGFRRSRTTTTITNIAQLFSQTFIEAAMPIAISIISDSAKNRLLADLFLLFSKINQSIKSFILEKK